MKKIILLITVLYANASQSQTPSVTTVPSHSVIPPAVTFDTLAAPTDRTSVAPPPEHIKTSFTKDYPGKKIVTWKLKGKHYVVSYTDPKTNLGHIIVYNKEGKIIQKENEVDDKTYPKVINNYLSKNYAGQKIKIWQTASRAGENYYYFFSKDKTIWFDKNGDNVTTNKVKSSDLNTYSADLK